MSVSTDDFLAHYGVRGMKWGERKAASAARKADDLKDRRDIMKDKHLDQIVDRHRKEKILKSLLDEDLAPNRTAAKKFVTSLFKDNQEAVLSGLATGASVALGVAFMSYRLTKQFDGITVSPIRLS